MRLKYRKHKLVVTTIIIFLGLLSYMFGLKPVIERTAILKRVIPENERKLQKLRIQSKKYLSLEAALENIKNDYAQKKSDYGPIAFLESICIKDGLEEKVINLQQESLTIDSNHSEIVAEIQIDNITLRQLVEFLLNIESSNRPLSIKSLYIEKAYASNLIDVNLRTSFLKMN